MKRTLFSAVAGWMLVVAASMAPQVAKAQVTYNVSAGAETKDQAVQADGFFPNEVWLLQGDSIKWTFVPKNEPHTVTFLKPGQVRFQAPPPVGPPAGPTAFPASCGPSVTPPSVSYNGSACVSSGVNNGGATFTVTFPTAGNYKLVCLIHTDMTGTVHVLTNTVANAKLIHNQRFYDDAAHDQIQALLADDDRQGDDDHRGWNNRDDWRGRDQDNSVVAGTGEIVATGGGQAYRAVVRFLPGTIRIHAGESVVWTNLDPTEPHTVTFGTEPTTGLNPTLYALPPSLLYPPSPAPNAPVACNPLAVPAVTTNCANPDTGTVLATINCTTSPLATAGTTPCDKAFKPQDSGAYDINTFVNSGFIAAAVPDRVGLAQVPPGITRIRITFPNKGVYYYHCALHDTDGMNGTVIVE